MNRKTDFVEFMVQASLGLFLFSLMAFAYYLLRTIVNWY